MCKPRSNLQITRSLNLLRYARIIIPKLNVPHKLTIYATIKLSMEKQRSVAWLSLRKAKQTKCKQNKTTNKYFILFSANN